MPTSAQPPPARLPPPTCPHHVDHLLDAVSQPWPWTPLAPPLPHLLPATTDVIRTEPPTPWTPLPSISLLTQLALLGAKRPERRRCHRRDQAWPTGTARPEVVSRGCAVVVLVSEREESNRGARQRRLRHRSPPAPPRHRRRIPASSSLPRACCPPLRAPGELGHTPHALAPLLSRRSPLHHWSRSSSPSARSPPWPGARVWQAKRVTALALLPVVECAIFPSFPCARTSTSSSPRSGPPLRTSPSSLRSPSGEATTTIRRARSPSSERHQPRLLPCTTEGAASTSPAFCRRLASGEAAPWAPPVGFSVRG